MAERGDGVCAGGAPRYRSRRVRTVAAVASTGALLAVGAVVSAPQVAGAASGVSCGQTLTSSVTLRANLDCATTDESALYIGAPNVTVNLGGHTITATASYDGIYDDGYSGLKVDSGTIQSGYYGVYAVGSSGAYLSGVSLSSLKIYGPVSPTVDSEGVLLEYVDGASVTGTTVEDEEYGITLEYSEGSKASADHLVSSEYGIDDWYTTDDTVTGNSITGAYYGLYTYETEDAVDTGNTVTGSIYGWDDYYSYSTFSSNHTTDDFVGVYTYYSENLWDADVATGDTYGFYGYYTYSTVEGLTAGTDTWGVTFYYDYDATLESSHLSHNSNDGLYARPEGSYDLDVLRNIATGNRYGLYSTLATEGSLNVAVGNSVLDCYNVSCIGSPAAPAGPSVESPMGLPAGSSSATPPLLSPDPVTPGRP